MVKLEISKARLLPTANTTILLMPTEERPLCIFSQPRWPKVTVFSQKLLKPTAQRGFATLSLNMSPSCATSKALVIGLLSGAAITLLVTGLFKAKPYKKSEIDAEEESDANNGELLQTEIVEGVDGLIGNTPLMKIRSLSEATGCLVLVILYKTSELNKLGSHNTYLFAG